MNAERYVCAPLNTPAMGDHPRASIRHLKLNLILVTECVRSFLLARTRANNVLRPGMVRRFVRGRGAGSEWHQQRLCSCDYRGPAARPRWLKRHKAAAKIGKKGQRDRV